MEPTKPVETDLCMDGTMKSIHVTMTSLTDDREAASETVAASETEAASAVIPTTVLARTAGSETDDVQPSDDHLTLKDGDRLDSVLNRLNECMDKKNDTVILSRTECDELLSIVDSKKYIALHNIHLLLKEKEDELISSRERNTNYSNALIAAEHRNACIVKLLLSGGPLLQDLNSTVAESNISSESKPTVDEGSVLQGTGSHAMDEVKSRLDTRPGLPTGVLESDDSCHSILETDEPFVSHMIRKPLINPVKVGEDIPIRKHLSDVAKVECSSEQLSRTSAASVGDDDSTSNSALLTSSALPITSAASSNITAFSAVLQGTVPDVSNDLLSKVMAQNARLKRVIREILQSQGKTIEQYMDQQEHEDVVDQLRQELQISRSREKELRELLDVSAGDITSQETRTSVQLLDKVHKLERALLIKQVMVDAYGSKYDELQDELTSLKSSPHKPGTTATSSSTQHSENNQALKNANDKKTSPTQELLSRFDELQKKYKASERQLKNEITQLMSQLEAKTHQCQELERRLELLECNIQNKFVSRMLDEREPGDKALFVDGDQESTDVSQNATMSSSQTCLSLTCERCETEFNDRDRYDDHCRKCTDE